MPIALTGHVFAASFDAADRLAEAPAHFERARALEPHDAWHELDYTEFFLARARALEKPAEVQAALVEAHRHFDVLRPAATWGDRDTAAAAKALLTSPERH
jgi:hypothetical protein